MSDDRILDHMITQSEAWGTTKQCMEQIQGDLHQLKESQKKLATKKDVNSKVDVAIGEHEQVFHPTRAEEVGQQVLNIWDQLMDHKKMTITAAGGITVLLLKLAGVG